MNSNLFNNSTAKVERVDDYAEDASEEDKVPHPGTALRVRGVLCTAFPSSHKMPRNEHKIPLGTIMPEH
jgi:hypothetical protein